MRLISNLVALLLLINVTIYGAGINIWNTDMQIFLQRCTGVCNKKYCNISHICRPVNRTSKVKSLDIYIHSGVKLEAPIYVEIIGNKKFRTEYRQHMLRIKEELCSLLLYKNHTLFKLANKPLLDRINNGFYGNLLEPCPFIRHRYLKPRTTNSDEDSFHIPLIPFGEWRLDVVISKKGERVLSFSDYYEVKATGIKEF